MTAPRLAAGTLLQGRYQLAEVIGESDLSAVYSATDLRGQAHVALKVFDASVMSRAAALSEYQAQARQASGLGVEGIARAYDFGIDANSGVPFSTAERISWASLDRRVLAQGPLGVADLSRAFAVLARALDAAHATGLLHRNLKPQNVFISPDNPEWVRITDFGVGSIRRGAPEAMGWGGPPGYTPPDAVDAAAPGHSGADLFALGVIAFFALTRATPFRSLRSPGFDPNSHWAELNQPLSPLSERAKEVGVALDPALDPWFARALTLHPQERFRSAGELARELGALADQVSQRGPRSIPGIAAAIAQPLVFQPEPSPESLGLAPTASVTTAAMQAVAAAPPPAAAPPSPFSNAADVPPGPRKKSLALPLMIGAGVLLLTGLATAGYLVLGKSKPADSQPEASASPSVAPPPASAAVIAAAPAAAPSVATGPAKARFSCQPEACEWVVCDGKNVNAISAEVEVTPGAHECRASRSGFASKATTFTAVAGEVSPVVFELTALPAAPQTSAAVVSTSQPVAATTAAAKPAAASTTTKAATPATTTKPVASAAKPAAASTAKPAASAATKAGAKATTATKKKCSTFLGCK